MKTRFLILAFLLLIFNTTAQELPNLTAHSPNVASLGQYGEYPVDFSTGVPKIEIPLYTITSGELQFPISLSYHASGVKVDQEASFVGLGWALNMGGVISRVIQDKVDENGMVTGFSTRGNSLPDYNAIDGEFPAGLVGNDPDPVNDGVIRTNYRLDKEPDIFSINSSLLSGQFCLNNSLDYVSLNYEPYKYDVDLINETIIVTNEKGQIFRFGKSLDNEEAHETTSVTNSALDASGTGADPSISSTLPYDSSWYLTEIISTNKKDTISFKYNSASYTTSRMTSENRYVPVDIILPDMDQVGTIFNGNMKYHALTSISNVRVPDKILFKNGSIEFDTAVDRLDMGFVPRITGFRVLDKYGNQIKKVVFTNNSYFDRTAGTGIGLNNMPIDSGSQRRKSLKLDGVKFYDSNNTFVNDYEFEYDATSLPPRNTADQDFWGYYTSSSSNTLIPSSFYSMAGGKPVYLGSNRDSNFNYMKAATLNKIVFPTKGHTTFDYEPNYYLDEFQQNGQTLKTKTISLAAINRLSSCPSGFFDGIPVNNTLDFTVTEDIIDNGIEYDGTLSVMFSDYTSNGAPSMSFRLSDITNGGAVVHFFEHLQADKNIYKVHTEGLHINEGHTYRLEAMTNSVTGSNMSICDSPWIEVTLTYDYYTTATPQQITPKQAGGLRVKTITNYDSDNSIKIKKEYTYGEVAYGPNGIGAGTLISDPSKYFYYSPLLYCVINEPGTSQTPPKVIHVLKDMLWFTSTSQVELGTNNGNPVDYNKVTEFITSYNNSTLTNGKTEHYYSQTGRDVDKSYATSNRPYDRFIYPSWKKRNLLKTVYNKQKGDLSYEPIRSDSLEYTDLPELRIKTLKIIEREPKTYYKFNGAPLENSQNRFYYYNFYQSIGKRILSKKTTKEYENAVEKLASTSSYFYGNTDHMQQTIVSTTNSKGELLKTKIEYPQDLSSPSAAELGLISKHQLAIPIITETYKKDGTNAEELLSTQRTNYKDWDVDLGLPTNTDLVLPENIQTSKGTGSLDNRIKYHDYYSNGNVQEVSKTDGTHIVYIWGYNEEYPIAKIENATYSDIPTSIYNSIVSKSDLDDSVSDENILRTELDKLRNPTYSPNLVNAMITTYTFDPLIGVTSVTDPKGYTMYYEYDDANRLKQVKDADGNILSKNEYHYKSQ